MSGLQVPEGMRLLGWIYADWQTRGTAIKPATNVTVALGNDFIPLTPMLPVYIEDPIRTVLGTPEEAHTLILNADLDI